jgi:hypothetical protein
MQAGQIYFGIFIYQGDKGCPVFESPFVIKHLFIFKNK